MPVLLCTNVTHTYGHGDTSRRVDMPVPVPMLCVAKGKKEGWEDGIDDYIVGVLPNHG